MAMASNSTEEVPALGVAQMSLAALFVTALISAQVTATKVLEVSLPVSLPVTGEVILVPAAVFAYALTFFASDCYTELYGKRAAQILVNVAFVMNFVLLALVWLAIWAPISPASEVAQEPFAETLAASTGVVAGSLLAYIVSQNWDVVVFHRIKSYTSGRSLWLRNIGSTATSQLIDTVIFITVAFYIFQGLPLDVVFELLVGQYLFKLVLAGLDTPFVYLAVGLVRRSESGGA
jgi:uncharacterized integral membrane protein (TIGR00697 family)